MYIHVYTDVEENNLCVIGRALNNNRFDGEEIYYGFFTHSQHNLCSNKIICQLINYKLNVSRLIYL